MNRKLVIEIRVKFRWVLTWWVYEKRMEIPLSFPVPMTGELKRVEERGASIRVSIE